MDENVAGQGRTVVCPECQTSNPASNRFCGNCGTSLQPASVVTTSTAAEKKAKGKPRLRRWLIFAAIGLGGLCILCSISLVFWNPDQNTTPTAVAMADEQSVQEIAQGVSTTGDQESSTTAQQPSPTQPSDTPMPTSTPQPTRTSKPTNTPRPTNTPKPTKTPTSTPSPIPTIEPYDVWKQSAQDISYNMVDKSDQYVGERVCWSGKVFNIEESLGATAFQAWYGDTLDAFIVFYDGTLPDVFKDTRVEICGLLDEKFEGTNAFGAAIVQPRIQAVYVVTPAPKPTAKPKPKATTPPTATPTLAKIGEQTKAGNWLFTVTEVQYHKALYFYDEARVAMGVYCVLFIDIQNQASGTTHFGELWWELRGAGGKVYDDDATTFRAAWQFGGKDTHYDDINPGQTAQIVIAFDVAQDAKGLQFYSYQLKQPFVLIGDAQPPQDQ